MPGLSTPVYAYDGKVPGPVVRVRQGERVKLRVRNHLPALHPQFGHPFNTSTHLHGSASLAQFDGYADDVTPPGDYKDYWYPNWQPARGSSRLATAPSSPSCPACAIPRHSRFRT